MKRRKRRSTHIRQTERLPIPDDWLEGDGYTLVAMCVPNSVQWHAIVLGAISRLTYGPFWDVQTGQIPEAQQVAREIVESIHMACADDVINTLNSLVEAVNNLDLSVTVNNQTGGNGGEDDDMTTTIINNYGCGCCGDGQSGTTTTHTDTPTGVFDPPAISGPVNQQPPPGFEQWSDYVDYKCIAAHNSFDQIYKFLGFWDGWVGGSLAIGVTDVISTVRGLRYYWLTSENIVSFVANLFQWAVSPERPDQFWFSFRAELLKSKDWLICALYNSPSAQEAIDVAATSLEENLDNTLTLLGFSTVGPLKTIGLTLITNLLSTSLFNDLFQKSENIPDNSDKTCDCGSTPPTNTGVCYSMNTQEGFGSVALLSNDGSTQVWRVTPEFIAGEYKVNLQAYNDSSGDRIAYQATAVAVNNAPSGGFDFLEVTYEDGSQASAFSPGCVDFLRYESVSPGWSLDVAVDLTAMDNCAGCSSTPSTLPITWTFDNDDEGWTFTDESSPTPANSATMAYEASTQALRNTHSVVNGSNQEARIECHSPALNIVPPLGSKRVTINFGAPSDGIATGASAIVHFASSPSEHIPLGAFSSAYEAIVNYTTDDTVTGVTVLTARSTGGGNGPWNFTVDILDVTLD